MDDRPEQPTTAHPTEEQAMPETTKLDNTLPEPPAPATPEAAGIEAEQQRRSPSVPTVVWGLLFGLIAAAVLVGQVSDVDLNLDVSAPLALLVAGVALVVWGIAGLGRSRRT
jgi:hypothetical protein